MCLCLVTACPLTRECILGRPRLRHDRSLHNGTPAWGHRVLQRMSAQHTQRSRRPAVCRYSSHPIPLSNCHALAYLGGQCAGICHISSANSRQKRTASFPSCPRSRYVLNLDLCETGLTRINSFLQLHRAVELKAYIRKRRSTRNYTFARRVPTVPRNKM